LLKFIKTLALAGTGSFLFRTVGIPLPWMLGPLAFILLWQQWSGERTFMPGELRNGALIVLGLVMGKSFSREAAVRIVQQLPSIVLATLLTILFSLAVGYLVYRCSGIKLPSAILGSIPGGLSQMVVLSEEVEEAEAAVVTLMQTIRLLLVVFLVPFVVQKGLAAHSVINGGSQAANNFLGFDWGHLLLFLLIAAIGGVLAARLQMPTPYLLGPVLVAALLVLAGFPPPQLPPWLIIIAQVIMGISMAANFKLEKNTNLRRLLLLTVAGNVGVVLFTFVLGYLLSCLHPQSLVTSFLSMAPGGMSEMGVTAVVVGADLAVVTSYQLFRMLFILLVVPPILRRLLPRLSAWQKYSCDTAE